MDDYALLGLGKATSLIERVDVDEGKGGVLLSCLYDPLGTRLPYRLHFQGCRSISRDTYPPPGEPLFPADFMGLVLGAGQHRKPATITTDTFELSFSYENFVIERP